MGQDGKRIFVISPSFPPTICGVGDHTTKLVRELAALQPQWQWQIITTSPEATGEPLDSCFMEENIHVDACVLAWKGPAFLEQMRGIAGSDGKPDAILLQYTPHLYDRLGINLHLCQAIQQFSQAGIPVYIIIHEMYVPLDFHIRHWITGPVQRWMMHQLLTSARGAFLSTRERQRELQKRYPAFAEIIHYLPVTSNIDRVPWTPEEGQDLKAKWCNSPSEKLLMFWGKLHSSKLLPVTLQALTQLQKLQIPFQALYIGPDNATLKLTLETRFPALEGKVHMTGSLPEAYISRYLQTADLLLYPLDDGASPRRGALMAAIQHGTPTITSVGPATDDTMKGCPNLVFSTSPCDFSEKVVAYCQEPSQVASEGAMAMHRYFQQHYTWQTIAETLFTRLNRELS